MIRQSRDTSTRTVVYGGGTWSTTRYESQANDSLHEDYLRLRGDMEYLEQHGELPSTASLFEAERLLTTAQLTVPRDAIKTESPLGRAISALSLGNRARDWVTGEELTPGTVRQLETDNQLDRHHVFSKKALTRGQKRLDQGDPLVNHGLNTVLLRKRANITLGGRKPAVYLNRLLETNTDLPG